MNNESCHKLIDRYYPDPVMKTYTPTGYELRRATTPAGRRKLDDRINKENGKLEADFRKRLNDKNAVHRTVDAISEYPVEVRELFFGVFDLMISDIEYRHSAYAGMIDGLTAKWGKEIVDRIHGLEYLLVRSNGLNRYKTETVAEDVSDDEWTDWLRRNRLQELFGSVTDRRDLFNDFFSLRTARENDDIALEGPAAYQTAIRRLAANLDRICADIRTEFDGNVPTGCETDPRWGVNGCFNGILTDGDRRISFKSFHAGGHAWGVQRFHYRFKCTRLKQKKTN